MPNPKLPTRTKVIRHTFRGDRASKNEPEPVVLVEVPVAPPGLPKAGKALWERLSPELVRIGLLTVADLDAYEALCTHWGIAADIYDQITRVVDPKTKKMRRRTVAEYLTDPPPKGKGSKRSPVFERIAILDRMRAEDTAAFRIMQHFGMTPAARSRLDIGLTEKEQPSAIKRMMNGE